MHLSDSFDRHFRRLGWSEAQIRDVFAWAISQPPNQSTDYLLESFDRMARKRGIPLDAAKLVISHSKSMQEA